MKTPVECHCDPNLSHKIVSTDVKLIRRVRRTNLENAARWELLGEEWAETVICSRWTAYQCLLQLRELKKEGVR